MEARHSSEWLAPRYGATLHPTLDDSNGFILFFLLNEQKTSPSTLIFNVGGVLLAFCSTMSSFFFIAIILQFTGKLISSCVVTCMNLFFACRPNVNIYG